MFYTASTQPLPPHCHHSGPSLQHLTWSIVVAPNWSSCFFLCLFQLMLNTEARRFCPKLDRVTALLKPYFCLREDCSHNSGLQGPRSSAPLSWFSDLSSYFLLGHSFSRLSAVLPAFQGVLSLCSFSPICYIPRYL